MPFAQAARSIVAGDTDLVVVAGGVESMSRAPFVLGKAAAAYDRAAQLQDTTLGWRFVNPALEAVYGVDTMGQTAENVAKEWGASRQDQDAFAQQSQKRAARATANGRLNHEITPVEVLQRRAEPLVVDHDEHLRAGAEGLVPASRPSRGMGR